MSLIFLNCVPGTSAPGPFKTLARAFRVSGGSIVRLVLHDPLQPPPGIPSRPHHKTPNTRVLTSCRAWAVVMGYLCQVGQGNITTSIKLLGSPGSQCSDRPGVSFPSRPFHLPPSPDLTLFNFFSFRPVSSFLFSLSLSFNSSPSRIHGISDMW